MREHFTVISGGEPSPLEDIQPGSFVIACDRGYEYACRAGIKTDLMISDFDSYCGRVAEDVPVERFCSEKDDTDTMIALRYALDHGGRSIDLRCALGGRLDHLLANLQAAVFAAKRGAQVRISDENTEILTMTPGRIQLKKREGFSLSLFSAADECRGVYVSGVKYPLADAVVTNTFPIGVSNEWQEDLAEICLGSGVLLIIMSRL